MKKIIHRADCIVQALTRYYYTIMFVRYDLNTNRFMKKKKKTIRSTLAVFTEANLFTIQIISNY